MATDPEAAHGRSAAQILVALRRQCRQLILRGFGLCVLVGGPLSQHRLPANLPQEDFPTLIVREMRGLASRRQGPDPPTRRVNQPLPDQILSRPMNLVVEALLSRLQDFVPEGIRNLLGYCDPVKRLSWRSRSTERAQGIEQRPEPRDELGLPGLAAGRSDLSHAIALLICSSTSFALAGIGVPGP